MREGNIQKMKRAQVVNYLPDYRKQKTKAAEGCQCEQCHFEVQTLKVLSYWRSLAS